MSALHTADSIFSDIASTGPLRCVMEMAFHANRLKNLDHKGASVHLKSAPATTVNRLFRYFWRLSTIPTARGPPANLNALFGTQSPMDPYMIILTTSLACKLKGIPFTIWMTDSHFLIGTTDGTISTAPGTKSGEWFQTHPRQQTFRQLLAYLPEACGLRPRSWIHALEDVTDINIWSSVRFADIFGETPYHRFLLLAQAVADTDEHYTIILPIVWLAQYQHLKVLAAELLIKKLTQAIHFKSHHPSFRMDAETTTILIDTFDYNATVVALILKLDPPATCNVSRAAPDLGGRYTRARANRAFTQNSQLVHVGHHTSTIRMQTPDGHVNEYSNITAYAQSEQAYRALHPDCHLPQNLVEAHLTRRCELDHAELQPIQQDALAHTAKCLMAYLNSFTAKSKRIYMQISDQDSIDTGNASDDVKMTIIALYDGTAWYGMFFDHVYKQAMRVGLDHANQARHGRQSDHLRQVQQYLKIPSHDTDNYRHMALPEIRQLDIFATEFEDDLPVTVDDAHELRHEHQLCSAARLATWVTWCSEGATINANPRRTDAYARLETQAQTLAITWRSEAHRAAQPATHWMLPWLYINAD